MRFLFSEAIAFVVGTDYHSMNFIGREGWESNTEWADTLHYMFLCIYRTTRKEITCLTVQYRVPRTSSDLGKPLRPLGVTEQGRKPRRGFSSIHLKP